MDSTSILRPGRFNGADDLVLLRLLEAPQHERFEQPPVNATSQELKNLVALARDFHVSHNLRQIQLGIGDCNTGVSRQVVDRALARINDDGHLHFPYGDMRGNVTMLEAAKAFWHRTMGVEARDFMVITGAGRGAVYFGMCAFRDAMIKRKKPCIGIVAPTWSTYADITTKFFNGNAKVITTSDGVVHHDALDRFLKASPDVGMLIFCNPVNPTGAVYQSGRLTEIIKVLHRHQVALYSDEMYALYFYPDQEGEEFPSVSRVIGAMTSQSDATLCDAGIWMAHNTIVLGGVMKATGSGNRTNVMWIPDPNLRSRFVAYQGAVAGPAPYFSQLLQAEYINAGEYEQSWHEMAVRRLAIIEMVTTLQTAFQDTPIKISHVHPKGGFYMAVNIHVPSGWHYKSPLGDEETTIATSFDLSRFLALRAAVVGAPDVTALIEDPSFQRWSYGNVNLDQIPRAGQQVAYALARLAVHNGYQLDELAANMNLQLKAPTAE